jgi:hypothetical protein
VGLDLELRRGVVDHHRTTKLSPLDDEKLDQNRPDQNKADHERDSDENVKNVNHD